MKIDVSDHNVSVLLTKHSDNSIKVTLQPYAQTQTSIIFPLDKMAEALALQYNWLFKQEVPDRPNFRLSIVKKVKQTASLCLFLALLTSFSSAETCRAKDPTCDSRAQLALTYMSSIFGDRDTATDVWINHAYDTAGRVRLERRAHKLEQLMKWATILPTEDERAYRGAIAYYLDGTKEAYAEWHTHDLQRTQAAYEKHLRDCEEAARKSAAKHALPKPPASLLEK